MDYEEDEEEYWDDYGYESDGLESGGIYGVDDFYDPEEAQGEVYEPPKPIV